MDHSGIRNAVEQRIEKGGDGIVRAVRVEVASADAICVWSGVLAEAPAADSACSLDRDDFLLRAVVYFTSWVGVSGFYAGSPFEPLVEAIRQRTLRFSTFPPYPAND